MRFHDSARDPALAAHGPGKLHGCSALNLSLTRVLGRHSVSEAFLYSDETIETDMTSIWHAQTTRTNLGLQGYPA